MKKTFIFVAMTLLVVLFLSGCCSDPAQDPKTTTYTVTFHSNGGSDVASATVKSGEKITKPTDPTKATFTFGGWYKEAALTTVWDFTTDTVTANITLYAKWNPGLVTLAAGSYGTAGNGEITDLSSSSEYIVLFGGKWYTVKADGTLDEKATLKDAIAGKAKGYTEITGLTGGQEYNVFRYVSVGGNTGTVTQKNVIYDISNLGNNETFRIFEHVSAATIKTIYLYSGITNGVDKNAAVANGVWFGFASGSYNKFTFSSTTDPKEGTATLTATTDDFAVITFSDNAEGFLTTIKRTFNQ